MTQPKLVAFRNERRRRLRDEEARHAKTIIDKALIRARQIIEDAEHEAQQRAKTIVIEAEHKANLVTEKAYSLGLANADAKVRANDAKRKSLGRKASPTTK